MTQEQNTQAVTLYIENVKELFQEMFREQRQVLIKIFSNCSDTMNQRLDKLALQVSHNIKKLKEICKESKKSRCFSKHLLRQA